MTRTPRQLLDALTSDAARAALGGSRYVGQDVDVATFADANGAQLLLLIARYHRLRAELAERYATELADSDPLLRQLTDPDPAVAEPAAAFLGQDPGRLHRSAAATKAKRAPQRAVSVDERRTSRAHRDLAEARAARDRARGQTEWAIRERDATRRELDAALTDRDEALTIIESLRAQLDTERQCLAVLAV